MSAGSGSDLTLSPGRLLAGRFLIQRLLGRGGMGEVYEALDTELRARVALKTIRPEIAKEPGALDRFRQEVQLARRVTHPNVCRVFDLWHDPPWPPFVTMELLCGETLSEHLAENGAMAPGDALPIVQQMIAALAAAHGAGVIHRDFKPGNVILVPQDEQELPPRVVVTDFGIAQGREVWEPAGTSGTPSSEGGGTPEYMAPEQVSGGAIGPATDIYALGLVMREMITTSGLRAQNRVDPAWEAAILRCLERDPADRFHTVEDVAEALTRRGRREKARRLAILPPLDRGGASSNGWISAMIVELLGRDLAAGEGLHILPAEDVRMVTQDLEFPKTRESRERVDARLRRLLGADLVLGGWFETDPAAGRIRWELDLFSSAPVEILARVAGTASEAEICAELGTCAARIREALKLEQPSSREIQLARSGVSTRSDALRFYAEGLARLRVSDDIAACRSLQQAISSEMEFPLAHAALAEGWFRLGHEKKAAHFATRAFEMCGTLSREERLLIEARYRMLTRDSRRGLEIYRGLWVIYPERLEYGLKLADALVDTQQGSEAMGVVEELRALPAPLCKDVRVDLVEARAAESLSEFDRLERIAGKIMERGRASEMRLLHARGRGFEAQALRGRGRLDEALRASLDARRTYARLGDRSGVGEELLRTGIILRDRGHTLRSRRCLDQALSIFTEIGREQRRVTALISIGTFLAQGGDLSGALRVLEECLALCLDLGYKEGIRITQGNMAGVLKLQGDLQGAWTRYGEALAIARLLGNEEKVSFLLSSMSRVAVDQGNLQRARELAEEALLLARRRGDQSTLANTLVVLAGILTEQDEVRDATRMLDESMSIRRRMNQRPALVESLYCLAEAYLIQGNLVRAHGSAGEAVNVAREIGRPGVLAAALERLGNVHMSVGDLDLARRCHEESLELRNEAGEIENVAHSRQALAAVCIAGGKFEEAEGHLESAVAEFQRGTSRDHEARTHALWAALHLATNESTRAEEAVNKAKAFVSGSQSPYCRRMMAIVQGRVQGHLGRVSEAMRILGAALSDAQAAGYVEQELDVRLNLGELELSTKGRTADRGPIEALEREAAAAGFGLIARRTADLLARYPALGGWIPPE